MEKTKNQIIADFVGYVKRSEESKDPYLYAVKHAYQNDAMHYHDNWEWLISVIKFMKGFNPPEEFDTPEMLKGLINLYESVVNNLATLNMETTYNSVFRYIDWYNRKCAEILGLPGSSVGEQIEKSNQLRRKNIADNLKGADEIICQASSVISFALLKPQNFDPLTLKYFNNWVESWKKFIKDVQP